MHLGHAQSELRPAEWRLSSGRLALLWLLAGGVLLINLGNPGVQRTQEARVLETARQMVDGTFRDWMIPVLNGQVRLQKPPLAYWLAAGSYSLFGVSEWAGRLPTALVGWLLLGATFWAGQWLFGRRAGFLAAVSLLGSYMFFRLDRLAETDAPAALGVTLGVFGFWRACASAGAGKRWFHLGAAGTGLAVMAKGGPGLFPVLFFLAWVALNRQWRQFGRLLRSGAPLTLILIAVPWFIYVAATMGVSVFRREVHDVLAGEDHGSWFYDYFPQIIFAVIPWCALVPLALWEAGCRWKTEPPIRGLLVWTLAVFVPLCVAGNKQAHYLLPLLPPLMIALAWLIELTRTRRASALLDRCVRALLSGTLLASSATGLAVLIAPRFWLGHIRGGDVALAAAVSLLSAAAWGVYRRRGVASGALAGSLVWAVLLPFVLGWWMPSLSPRGDVRAIAQRMQRRFGQGPYCFYGGDVSFPLCFSLRTVIPLMNNQTQLQAAMISTPGLLVIVPVEGNRPAAPLPPTLGLQMEEGEKGHHFRIYRASVLPGSDSLLAPDP